MSSNEPPKSFISIRINGHSLRELEARGICLKTILKGLGLDDTVITDGSLPSSAPKPISTLNTTIVSIGSVPRSSTPISRQVDLCQKFTFNLDGRFSEIVAGEEKYEDLEETVAEKEVEEEKKTALESLSFARSPAQISNASWPDMGSHGGSIDHYQSFQAEEGGSRMDETATIMATSIRQEDSLADAPEQDSGTSHYEDVVDRNTWLTLQCRFPNCAREIKWKVRNGRCRLFNHALVHNKTRFWKCRDCGEKNVRIATLERMRYHYQTVHKGIEPPCLGMRSMPTDSRFFKNLVKKCFGDQLDRLDETAKPKGRPASTRRSQRIRTMNSTNSMSSTVL